VAKYKKALVKPYGPYANDQKEEVAKYTHIVPRCDHDSFKHTDVRTV